MKLIYEYEEKGEVFPVSNRKIVTLGVSEVI